MVEANKHGQMVHAFREIIIITKKMVEENLNGLTEIVMLDNLDKIEKVDREWWNMVMVDNIEEAGLMIKCMDMDNLYGHKVKVIKDLIKMTWSMDLVKWFMEMILGMKDIGFKENKMEKVYMLIIKEEDKKEIGKMEW